MKARFYKETGFNSVDIPDSLSLIKNDATQVKYKSNVSLLQVDNIYKITTKGWTLQDARSIDYVIIEDNNGESAGYFLHDRGYEFKSPDICTFFLQLDPYATIGGLVHENEIISGSANRLTVDEEEENSKYFTAVEPYQQTVRPIIAEGILDGRIRDTQDEITLLETLVIPPKTLKDEELNDNNRNYGNVNVDAPVPAGMPQYIQERYFATIKSNPTIIQTKENIASQDRITSTNISDIQTFEYRDLIETNLIINGLYGDVRTIRTGSRWWKGDQLEGTCTVKGKTKKTTVINDLRITGSDNNITNYWSVPTPYIKTIASSTYNPMEFTNYGGIDTIESSVFHSNDNLHITTGYDMFNLKNNKAKYGQSTSIIVYSPISGERLEKDWPSIVSNSSHPYDNSYRADFSIGADIRPEGCPIFKFKYNNGTPGDLDPTTQGYQYEEMIKGGPWRQIPISGQGAANALSQIALNQSKEQLNYKTLLGIGAGLAGIGLGIATGGIGFGALGVGLLASQAATSVVNAMNPQGTDAGYQTAAGSLIRKGGYGVMGGTAGVIGSIGNYAIGSLAQAHQQDLLNKQGNSAFAAVSLSTSNFVRELGYNTFYVMYIMYGIEDMQAFDRFLTLYGYNVGNKKITSGDFDSRPGFNYIRVNDIDILSDKGVWLVERVREQLKAGVRIWHEMPNSQRIAQGNKGV